FISHMSLNSVTITVDGAMTFDTSAFAPKVEDVKFDKAEKCGGDQSPCFWSDLTSDQAIRTGAIFGSYLTGGKIELTESDEGIVDLKTVPEGSNDQRLNFSFKLKQAVPSGTELHFKVTKPVFGIASLNAKQTDSKELTYVVPGPIITDEVHSAQTVTITGKGFP